MLRRRFVNQIKINRRNIYGYYETVCHNADLEIPFEVKAGTVVHRLEYRPIEALTPTNRDPGRTQISW